jgi:hypothetical protein
MAHFGRAGQGQWTPCTIGLLADYAFPEASPWHLALGHLALGNLALGTSHLAPRTPGKVSQECVIPRGVTGTNNEGSSSSEDEKKRVDREAIAVAAVLQRQRGG